MRRVGPARRALQSVATLSGIAEAARGAWRALGEMFYGATGLEFERQAVRCRGDLENLFVFMIMGDLVGVPVLPPYYALRLVPYVVETVPVWRRRVLRERHPLEREEFDLHGV
jgi:hypothetical protein